MIHREVPDAPPPHVAHARLAKRYDTTFILESREGPKEIARYSFVGFDPVGTITYERSGLQATGGLPAPSRDQDPVTYLRRILDFYRVGDHDTPFVGGLVGSIGYDFVRAIEPVLEHRIPGGVQGTDPGADQTADGHGTGDADAAVDAKESWPRFLWGLYLDGLVYDHVEGSAHYVSRGEDRRERLLEALADEGETTGLRVGAVTPDRDQTTFESHVRDAQEEIRAGEAFQIVLSRAYHGRHDGSLTDLYAWLREHAPVPYLYHLRFQDRGREVVGASPEMLVRVREGVVESFPIAGTRATTGDEREDRRLADDLLADRKEGAEHAMLVDLARNDLGRVAAAGSVEVAAYRQIKRFRDVQHIVSHVRARLDPERDALDALAAVFPAGTVSGAPKVRALEHIDRIEAGHPRGPYAGAVAYASFNGDFDSAIAIRSLSAQDGRLTVQAGAGIVIHSDPVREFQETQHKAHTLLDALRTFGATIEEAAPERTKEVAK